VLAFPSDYGLLTTQYEYNFLAGVGDIGLNALYVADASFSSPTALIDACAIAVESARVMGADLWVGGMAQQSLPIAATVTLVDDPSKLPIVPIRTALTQAILAYFSRTTAGFLYKRSGIEARMRNASAFVQTVTFTAPTGDPTLAPMNWPAVLNRYVPSAASTQLTFAPPV
jgi:hypothetical protein